MRQVLAVVALTALACGCAAAPAGTAETPPAAARDAGASARAGGASGEPLHLRIVAFNDFHGNLRPPTGHVHGVTGDVGGVAYFATHVKRLTAGQPNSIVVAAGDLVGASPLTSALFHDEPTVEAMNLIGLDVMAIGNHEFDEGLGEVLRLKRGGCHPVDGCALTPTYPGARFDILGANVLDAKTGQRVLPAAVVRTFEGISVGFIGMTLQDTPSVVLPTSVEGLKFEDEVRTTAGLVTELRQKGVESIVVLVHQGGLVKGGGLDDCNDLHGPIVKIAEALDPAVDVIVTGHTHALYNCRIAGRPVTSALSFGRVVTTIDLTIDRATRDVVRSEAHNHAITHDVPPDPGVQAVVDRASALAAPKENRPIGHITATLRAATGASGESALGAVIADAQLAATKKSGAVIALMNTGGLRADLVYDKSPVEPEDGVVTFGEAFAAQPFGNSLVTITVSGASLLSMLEDEARAGSPLQVSQGFAYKWTSQGKKRVVSAQLDGKDIAPDAKVRITVNSFLIETQAALKGAADRAQGPADVVALEAYFKANRLIEPPKPRIQKD